MNDLSSVLGPRARQHMDAFPHGPKAAQIYTMLGFSILLCGALMVCAGLSLRLLSSGNVFFLIGLLGALAIKRGTRLATSRYARSVGECAESYALFASVCLIGALTSYPVAALSHGYADPALERIDLVLRFSWPAWYEVVAQHRALQILGLAAYESIYVTPAVLLAWYAFRGERREANKFLATFWLAALMTLALFSLMPAVGPLSFLWHGRISYMPVSELWQPNLIPALRAHRVHDVDLSQLRGLVSAPSFHAAAAVIYIATAIRIPRLRWPLILLNIAMLFATPVEGTHYLADIVLGMMVALAALAAMRLTFTRQAGKAAVTYAR